MNEKMLQNKGSVLYNRLKYSLNSRKRCSVKQAVH